MGGPAVRGRRVQRVGGRGNDNVFIIIPRTLPPPSLHCAPLQENGCHAQEQGCELPLVLGAQGGEGEQKLLTRKE